MTNLAISLVVSVVTNWNAVMVQPYLTDPVCSYLEQFAEPSTQPEYYQNGKIVEQSIRVFADGTQSVKETPVDLVTRYGSRDGRGGISWKYVYWHVNFAAIIRNASFDPYKR